MTGLDKVLLEVVGLLEARGTPYAVMGGLAVRIHALPRPTFDIDFTLFLPRSDLSSFYQELQGRGFTIPPAQLSGWVDTVRGLPVVKFQVVLAEQSIDVDLFLAETDFQRRLLERRQRHSAEGMTAWFVSPEDLILLKLLANRPKDRVDVADILFIQGDLDEDHLRQWANKLGVDEALAEALLARP